MDSCNWQGFIVSVVVCQVCVFVCFVYCLPLFHIIPFLHGTQSDDLTNCMLTLHTSSTDVSDQSFFLDIASITVFLPLFCFLLFLVIPFWQGPWSDNLKGTDVLPLLMLLEKNTFKFIFYITLHICPVSLFM